MNPIQRVAFRYIQSASQPLQDLAGVQTWVNNTRDLGKDKGTPAPEKSREDYADGKPQRDRVLPLPSGHPKGRTEYRANPPVFNAPSDSSGVTNGKRPNPNAIPNQPQGKPLHERPRSSGIPGDEYGNPYIDQSTSTGLKRRVAQEIDFYFDVNEDGELIKVGSISVKPPRKRQRKQKGQAKRYYQVRRLKLKRKNRSTYKRERKRYYLRNKHRIKRYRKRREDAPQLFKRYEGGGVSSNKQRNKKRDLQNRINKRFNKKGGFDYEFFI